MTLTRLIIFVKNPIPGQVKTRIARTVGDARAVEVYRHLLAYTQQLAKAFTNESVVYYGDFINPADGWTGYPKHLQTGADLGERMMNAFLEQFAAGAKKAIIIGSDCLAITPDHINRAIHLLDTVDVVIGPATDGGYYLLAMNQPRSFLFQGMPWSQPELCQRTERAVLQHGLTVARLEELTDIDEWADYERYV